MAHILIDVADNSHIYRVVFGKDAHYKISEHDLATGWGSAFRITKNRHTKSLRQKEVNNYR